MKSHILLPMPLWTYMCSVLESKSYSVLRRSRNKIGDITCAQRASNSIYVNKLHTANQSSTLILTL